MDKPYNNPIKIIYRVKHKVIFYHYYVYIFLGSPPSNIKKILLKIKDMSLIDCLQQLTQKELNLLTEYYGELWYTYFFTHFYIKNQFTLDNPNIEIIKKYIDITKFQTSMTQKFYSSYGSNFLYDKNLKLASSLYYKHKYTHNDLYYKYLNSIYTGGGANNGQVIDSIDKNIDDDTDDEINDDFSNINIDELTTEMINTYDTQNEQHYTDKQNEQDIKNIDNLSKNELNKISVNKFDNSYENVLYSSKESLTYKKYYIFGQYIYQNDTIDELKNKICYSILNKDIYSKSKNYIIPSRQYLWFYDNSSKANPLGFMWMNGPLTLNYNYYPDPEIKKYINLEDNIKTFYNDLQNKRIKLSLVRNNNTILDEYLKYTHNNDIYMVDIYNELFTETTRTQEELDILTKTYINIFYPDIHIDHIQNILSYINGTNPTAEIDYINKIYNDITPNLLLNTTIFNVINNILIEKKNKIKSIVKPTYIIQAKIVLKLKSDDIIKFNKLDLFKIFNDFSVNNKYIFIQFVQLNKKSIYKFHEKTFNDFVQNVNLSQDKSDIIEDQPSTLSYTNDEIISSERYKQIIKWFVKNKTGLTFKILVNNKIISVTINLGGDIYYKVHWKENDEKTFDDLKESYEIIKQLVKDINETSIINKFDIPLDNDFTTMFVSTIARFNLPNNETINHNDLSKFSRLFYPYFALVIDPKKRISKIHESDNISKYGTYLRYKRISNYENNQLIENQIKKYLQYYDATTNQIIDIICKQFNIIKDVAIKYYENVTRMYPNIKKKIKKLMTIDNTIRYKTPGVDVAIQGKTTDRYKLKITGVKNNETNTDIINICSVMFYLYYEIYINKNKSFMWISDLFKKINNIAERRYIVADVVRSEKEQSHIDTALDKYRIGYKPYKNQSYYKRVCQNYGNTRRQPQQYTDDSIDSFLSAGYKKNKATGYYEKQVILKNGQKKTLRAIELNSINDEGQYTNNKIYYTCDPVYNGEYIYVGYLTKSNNPFGEPIPCCFKKEKMHVSQIQNKTMQANEQLYILQDTIKLQEGRLGLLPDILNYFFNTIHNKEIKIDKHILVSSVSSIDKSINDYYFKLGVDNTKNSFISSIAYCLDLTYSDILMKCTKALNGPNKNLIFNALNNGDIKLELGNINNYLSILKKSNINIKYIINLLTLPGVILDEGLNIIVLQKGNKLESTFTYDYYLNYINHEDIHNINNKSYKTIIICADTINYFPICLVKKLPNNNDLYIKKLFKYEDEAINIIKNYYLSHSIKYLNNNSFTIKSINHILGGHKLSISYQIIDTKYKVRFIVIKSNKPYLLPVYESGSIYNIPIINNFDDYINTLDYTLESLKNIYSIKELSGYIPISLQYDKKKQNKYRIKSILLNNNLYIPVKKIYITDKQYEYTLIKIPYYINIDKYILSNDNKFIIDNRIKIINYNKFKQESYELFKYHISNYLLPNLKTTIKNIINSDLNINDKIDVMKGFFFRIINNKKLNDVYSRLKKYDGDEFLKNVRIPQYIHIYDNDDMKTIQNYKLDNIRKLCNKMPKNKCNNHCYWANKSCVFSLSHKTAILFINKLSQEIIFNKLKLKELLQEDNYYISSIINDNYYTLREGQKILIKTPTQKDNPFIKYYNSKLPYFINSDDNFNTGSIMQDNNNLKIVGNKYIQKIKSDKDGFIRAYANGLNWIINSKQSINNKNLGYASLKQEKISNYIKGVVVDYIMDLNNENKLKQQYSQDIIITFVKDSNDIDDIEQLCDILYNINKIDIILYNEYDTIIYKTNKNITPNQNNINIKINNKTDYFVIYY